MAVKQDAKSKIEVASKACDAAQLEWSSAARALGGTVSTNAYGIHHDSNQLRNKLLEAQEHIKKALVMLDEVDWPREADYDQAGM